MISLRSRQLVSRSIQLALITITMCTGNVNDPVIAQESIAASDRSSAKTGFVFAMTNEAKANRIVVFWRAANGALAPVARLHTGGHGTGSPLDSQGAVILSADHERLYVANPGSDQISVFDVDRFRLPRLIQVVASGGDLPLSLTRHGNVLYVLNAGTGGNLSGFRVRGDGTLRPLAGSLRMLTTPIGSPAQVPFNPDGNVLVVTHKATDVTRPPANIIDTFTVGADGLASPASPRRSNGLRPSALPFAPTGAWWFRKPSTIWSARAPRHRMRSTRTAASR